MSRRRTLAKITSQIEAIIGTGHKIAISYINPEDGEWAGCLIPFNGTINTMIAKCYPVPSSNSVHMGAIHNSGQLFTISTYRSGMIYGIIGLSNGDLISLYLDPKVEWDANTPRYQASVKGISKSVYDEIDGWSEVYSTGRSYSNVGYVSLLNSTWKSNSAPQVSFVTDAVLSEDLIKAVIKVLKKLEGGGKLTLLKRILNFFKKGGSV